MDFVLGSTDLFACLYVYTTLFGVQQSSDSFSVSGVSHRTLFFGVQSAHQYTGTFANFVFHFPKLFWLFVLQSPSEFLFKKTSWDVDFDCIRFVDQFEGTDLLTIFHFLTYGQGVLLHVFRRYTFSQECFLECWGVFWCALFFGHARGVQKFPGQGLNSCRSSDSTGSLALQTTRAPLVVFRVQVFHIFITFISKYFTGIDATGNSIS